jgi:hypothetical protein
VATYWQDGLDYADLAAAQAAGWTRSGTSAVTFQAGHEGNSCRIANASSGASTLHRGLGLGTITAARQFAF